MSDVNAVARDQLRSFIERIENLESEKQAIADDIKDVKGEAKGMGYCVKTINTIIKMRKQDADERAEQEAILDTYLISLGMLPQPDLFDDEAHDAFTGELSPKLAHTIVTGMQTEAGRAALVAAVDIMIDREEKNTRSDAPPASAAAVISSSNDTAKGEAGSPVGLPENPPETASEMDRAMEGSFETGSVAAENARKAIPDVGLMPQEGGDVTHAGAGGIPATNSEPDGGAISEVKGKARLENADGVEPPPAVTTPKPAPSMDELRIANALILRPSCKRPGQETCGGQGRTHCRDCMAAPVEKEREEA